MNASSIEKNRGAFRRTIKDHQRFDWTMEQMEDKQPQFAQDLKNAIDRGDPGLIDESTLYQLYDRERGTMDDVWDFLEAPVRAISTGIYASNPDFYDQKGRPSRREEFHWLGAIGALGGLMMTGSKLVPKMSPFSAGISASGFLTGGLLAAGAAMGELALPDADKMDDAILAFLKSFGDEPWKKKTMDDILPDSPNLAMALEIVAPDLAFDVGLPMLAGKLFKGAKNADAVVEKVDWKKHTPEELIPDSPVSPKLKMELEGVGVEEAKYRADHAARQSKIDRFESGKRLVNEYLKLTKVTKKGKVKPLTLKDLKKDVASTDKARLGGRRGEVAQEWIDLYHTGVPEEEVDAAYAIGRKIPNRPIGKEDMKDYQQIPGSGGGRLLQDVKRFTVSVFGADSPFMKYVDDVHQGVYNSVRETKTKREEFEALAFRAGVGKRSSNKLSHKLRTRSGKQGAEINVKMYEAVEKADLSKLDESERELYFWINNFYESALFDTNKILRSLGKAEIGTSYIKYVDGKAVRQSGNYLPRIWAINYLDELWGGLSNIPDDVIKGIDEVVDTAEDFEAVGPALDDFAKETSKKFKKEWHGGRHLTYTAFAQRRMGVKEDYLRDVIETFDQYNGTVNMIKHVSRPAEIAFRAIDQLEASHQIDASVGAYYKDWLSSGALHKRAPIDKILFPGKRPVAFKYVEKKVHDMSRNLLAGSLQFFMTNMASFPQYVAIAGTTDTARALWRSKGELLRGLPGIMRGMGAAVSGEGMSFARKNSQVLQMREFTGYENMGREIMKKSNILTAWENIIESADQFNVAWGFNTGYIKGRKLGLSESEAIKYADDIAAKTQAVYDRAFISPILRNRVVQTVVPFQTFTTNLYNFFRRDIMGGGLKLRKGEKEGDPLRGLSAAGKMGTMVRFLGMAYAINLGYKAIGLSPPWDLTSVIPFAPAVTAVTGEAIDEPYGAKTLQLTFLDPFKKIMTGLGADHYDMMDPEFRKVVEGVLMLQPRGFGLQANRTLTGLMDVASGGTRVPTGTGDTRFGRFKGPRDNLQAILFGPRKTDAYRKIRGEFEPQPSYLQSAGDILFPDDWPPYSDDE